jgi:hypothetical protein
LVDDLMQGRDVFIERWPCHQRGRGQGSPESCGPGRRPRQMAKIRVPGTRTGVAAGTGAEGEPR